MNEFQYRGEQDDASLQIYYLRARYYRPQTGRFLTQDTDEGDDGDPESLHKYLLADADPVDGMDPSGNADLIEGSLTNRILIAAAVFVTGYATYEVVQGARYNPTATDVECVLKKTGSALSNALLLAGVAPQAIFRSGVCRLPMYFAAEKDESDGKPKPIADTGKPEPEGGCEPDPPSPEKPPEGGPYPKPPAGSIGIDGTPSSGTITS